MDGTARTALACHLAAKQLPRSIVLPTKISNYARSLDIKTVTDHTAADAITPFDLIRSRRQLCSYAGLAWWRSSRELGARQGEDREAGQPVSAQEPVDAVVERDSGGGQHEGGGGRSAQITGVDVYGSKDKYSIRPEL